MAVFSVGEVICLVTPLNDRDLGLLNHVKYDSYLITSQRNCSRTHPQQEQLHFFSDMPSNNEIPITNTVYNYSFLFLKRVIRITLQ